MVWEYQQGSRQKRCRPKRKSRLYERAKENREVQGVGPFQKGDGRSREVMGSKEKTFLKLLRAWKMGGKRLLIKTGEAEKGAGSSEGGR